MPPLLRSRTEHWLKSLITAFPRARYVVTTRPSAAPEDWLAAQGFTAHTLLPMERDDVRAFIRHWHDAVRQECPPGRRARVTGPLRGEPEPGGGDAPRPGPAGDQPADVRPAVRAEPRPAHATSVGARGVVRRGPGHAAGPPGHGARNHPWWRVCPSPGTNRRRCSSGWRTG
ncbi:NACHT domain-containing protein [Streptomyces sp. NPDC055681]